LRSPGPGQQRASSPERAGEKALRSGVSIPHVAFIVRDLVLLQESSVSVLESSPPVVFSLAWRCTQASYALSGLRSTTRLKPGATQKTLALGYNVSAFQAEECRISSVRQYSTAGEPGNRAEKRRILNRESALQLLAVRKHSVVGRIRGSESAAFRPGWRPCPTRKSTYGNEQCAVGSRQSAVVSGQCAVGSAQSAVVSAQWAVRSAQLSAGLQPVQPDFLEFRRRTAGAQGKSPFPPGTDLSRR